MRHRITKNGIVKWVGEFDKKEFIVGYDKKLEEEKKRRQEERAKKKVTYNEEKAKNAFLNTVIKDLKESDLKILTSIDLTDRYGKNKRTSLTVLFTLLKEHGCLIPRPEGGDKRANYYDAVKIKELVTNETITYAKCAQLRKETFAAQAKRKKERNANSK